MTDKEHVQHRFPHSRCEVDGIMGEFDIWSGDFNHLFIGTAFTEDDAWKEAKDYLDNLPPHEKYKIQS